MITTAILKLRPPARFIALTALATLTMWLGQGCNAVNNDRVTVGDQFVPAIGGVDASGNAYVPDPLVAATGPSLQTGLRDHWQESTIVVPQDGVEHHPQFTRAQPSYAKSPRATGTHPTIDSAFELGSAAEPQIWEGFAAPFHGGTDVVLFIPRLFDVPKGGVTASPIEPRQRYRTGAMAPAEAPATSAPEPTPDMPADAPMQAEPQTP